VASLLNASERKMFAAELDPVLIRGGYFDDHPTGPRRYEDAVFQEAVPKAPRFSVSPKEVAGVVRWARQKMSEGAAGRELDLLLKARVEPQVMEAAAEKVASVRQRHEGLSGHVYADAGAYATPKTTRGCDDGGLRHRSNGLRYVLAMSRCASCVFKNADGVCQKYNKTLADDFSGDEMEDLRRRMMASHEATDQEQTAELFAVGTDAAENATDFGLHNASLDDVETEEPEHGLLDGIFFGGFEV
jgi:hypothetical protein